MDTHNPFLRSIGLVQAASLEQILHGQHFVADSNYQDPGCFPVYPVLSGRAHIAHDLLNLYGTHWRYLVSRDLGSVRKDDGDESQVFADLRKGVADHRHAHYAFTKRYLGNHQSLWLFVPGTEGYVFANLKLLPRFVYDSVTYAAKKQQIRQKPLGPA